MPLARVNAFVDVDPCRLDAPLRAFEARQGHSFAALLRRVPADVSKVFCRVFRENGAYFDITALDQRGGDWRVTIPAACFPTVGTFKYELHATALTDGDPVALGEGRLTVATFSTTTNPEAVGTVQPVAEIPCEGGGKVQIVMKWDGYEWMPEAVSSASVISSNE